MLLTWLLLFMPGGVEAQPVQYIAVQGRLACARKPLPNTEVKLFHKRLIGSTILAVAKTDKDGNFKLEGGIPSRFPMDAHLKINHTCKEKWPCRRIVDIKVPAPYVYRGSGNPEWLSAGTLDMTFKYPNQKRMCTIRQENN
ncbi:unnamed protein product [Cylicocyclus nassatus]|uniref:Transthyretin-like family protein n=1 Tax=Cylicocyclus nassatus TaxID=53992 RepID=A0AA36M6E5_CYLNA|nr:unnamed protein product [Cylicocyclus nassatus]